MITLRDGTSAGFVTVTRQILMAVHNREHILEVDGLAGHCDRSLRPAV